MENGSGLPLGRGSRLALRARQALAQELGVQQEEPVVSVPLGRARRFVSANLGAVAPTSFAPGLLTDRSSTRSDSGFVSGCGRGITLPSLGKNAVSQLSNVTSLSSQYRDASETSQRDKDISHELEKISELSIGVEGRKGTSGESVQVVTNLIELNFIEKKGVHLYTVDFEPEIEHSAFRFAIVREHFPKIPGIRCYDGSKTLYLPYLLDENKKTYSCKHPHDGSDVKLTLTFKKLLTLSQSVHMLNILLNNVTKELRFARIGRQSFNYKLAQIIPGKKLQIWPGFVTAVQEKDDGVYLTCDIISRVLRSETVYDVLKDVARKHRDRYKDAALKELLGAVVLTRYNNNMYRIDDISFDMSPLSTFTLRGGESITFLQYYKNNYNIDIMDLQQPLLLSKSKKKDGRDENERIITLVPEICHLTGISDEMRSDFRLMKEISACTKLSPANRHASLRQFLEQIHANENARGMLEEWGLKLPTVSKETTARIMTTPKIMLGGGIVVEGNADWSRALRTHKTYKAKDLNDWVIVHCERDKGRAQLFAQKVKECQDGLGMRIAAPRFASIRDTRLEDYVKAIRNNLYETTDAVVVIMHQSRDDLYSAVKRVCLKENPVISQVIVSNTLSKPEKVRPIVQNIVLQINAKLGGSLWAVNIPLKTMMVIGVDSYHDAAQRDRSVGAFVASYDPEMTNYFSQIAFQKTKQEYLVELVRCLVNSLHKYHEHNGTFPQLLVIYRDGVSDADFQVLKEIEVERIQTACKSINADYNPKLLYIVVQKRISTRYFLSSRNGEISNAPPGTVLDQTATKKGWDNFLIVSQHVRQGTASPNHYVVIYDDTGLKIDTIQKLTYAMCHLYYNWPGTVRVPAPCQYAHKLAQLVGLYVKARPHSSLDDKLYYL